ncbi:daunorubicin resistance protein DrrA family ABC transporter ATP-binding protein [Virgisporangium aliadipatigenens]|uniref:Daunorubicin resistance protein DrrA family ABC transporter ATP-binding protein n=1 Tax=Virgisporangium aliadipatigenens TaxID=741659 RepID=A0A8J3YVA3_9ACTN|nr:ATP-binding cassette domain-containing protein [Virgisporangium aliadipatigenens]GIJ51168.1 daunorubicin resistance protein DrrA family ABC transporter ATP-binding protein [Virgisporangium aliadipatigenens]
MTDVIVRATGLRKSYGKTEVLAGVDLAVRRGSIFALLGPNGAGKTTTVRILSTLIDADGGTAEVAGHDVRTEPAKVRTRISLTGQYAAVDELLTGEENLLMMGRLLHLPRAPRKARTGELLERFDLVDAAKRPVKTYSGGMRRRLDLAVSLLASPEVIFLDEPTTGLDPRSRQDMWQVVRDLARTGSTVLLTTQYLEEADQLADQIAVLDNGRVIAEGTADQLKSTLAGEQVELHLADAGSYDEATRLFNGTALHKDPERRSVSVATGGSAAEVRLLLNDLADRAIAVERITLRRPTLDDAFLSLTGNKR